LWLALLLAAWQFIQAEPASRVGLIKALAPAMNKCDLSFLCWKQWEELSPTDFAFSRFCAACSKPVFVCSTHSELAVAKALGRCVALMQSDAVVGWVGEPEGSMDWMEEPCERISFCSDHPLTTVEFAQLKHLYPSPMSSYSKPDDIAPDAWLVLGLFTPFVATGIVQEIAEKLPSIRVRRDQG
jgi:hypothetical protein